MSRWLGVRLLSPDYETITLADWRQRESKLSPTARVARLDGRSLDERRDARWRNDRYTGADACYPCAASVSAMNATDIGEVPRSRVRWPARQLPSG